MIIAKEKKSKNIVEYILYMWQIEDLIRSFKFNYEEIHKNIIEQFSVEKTIFEEIEIWYQGLIEQMKTEGKHKQGHLQFVTNTMNDLNDLHLYLLQKQNPEYLQFYSWSKSHIDELIRLSKHPHQNEIEAALNGLYGFLLLKLQKRQVTEATQESIQAISQMMAYLNRIYFQIERGEMEVEPE